MHGKDTPNSWPWAARLVGAKANQALLVHVALVPEARKAGIFAFYSWLSLLVGNNALAWRELEPTNLNNLLAELELQLTKLINFSIELALRARQNVMPIIHS